MGKILKIPSPTSFLVFNHPVLWFDHIFQFDWLVKLKTVQTPELDQLQCVPGLTSVDNL